MVFVVWTRQVHWNGRGCSIVEGYVGVDFRNGVPEKRLLKYWSFSKFCDGQADSSDVEDGVVGW